MNQIQTKGCMPGPKTNPTELDWSILLSQLQIHFQPIVNLYTGQTLGLEALVRGWEAFGLATPPRLFALAAEVGKLEQLEESLREQTLTNFLALRPGPETRLFYNIHPQLPRLMGSHLLAGLEDLRFEVCLETPETATAQEQEEFFSATQAKGFSLALDDFGQATASLGCLLNQQLHFLKLDRNWVGKLTQDGPHRVATARLVETAHLLGLAVIGEGVETVEEFYSCKNLSLDYLQGTLIQGPTDAPEDLLEIYSRIEEFNLRDRRRKDRGDSKLLLPLIEPLEPITTDMGMELVLERFRKNKGHSFFPVVNEKKEPIGIIREMDLKEYVYSSYGRELLLNRNLGIGLLRFVTRCPQARVEMNSDEILKLFSQFDGAEGVIMVRNLKYVGFLTAQRLLKLINEKNLTEARDQNPLTRLPGNNQIKEYLAAALAETGSSLFLVYFDFDNFKPFNDIYGFRDGDRAILLFAEILAKELDGQGAMIGHIGGDDFFVGFKAWEPEKAKQVTKALVERFGFEAASLYHLGDREVGYITAKDRNGITRCFNLLSVSAALLEVPLKQEGITLEELSPIIAQLKKYAKEADGHLAIARYQGKGKYEFA